MFKDIFEKLDAWIDAENNEARLRGYAELPHCEFRIVGQIAIQLADLNIQIARTNDFDAFNNAKHEVLKELAKLLAAHNLELESLSHNIWMPEETIYRPFFEGDFVTVYRAMPEFVMTSKSRFALQKNKILVRQYIASSPPQSFFDMCQKYKINLEKILED